MKKFSYFIIFFMVSICSFSQNNSSSTIEDLQNEIENLVKINDQLRAEITRLKSEKPQANITSSYGEEYRIQLGVQNGAIGSLTTPKPMSGTMVNGKMVYDIGGFRNPNEAFVLSQEMRKLNLAGSFVTRHINGVRDYSYRYDPNQPQPSYRPSYNNETGALNLGMNKQPAKKSAVLVIEE